MKRLTVLLVLLLVAISSVFSAERELFREAEGRYRSGNYTAALDLYNRFIAENRISPDVPDARFKSAVCLYQLGRYDESLKLFSRIRKEFSSTEYIDLVPFWQGRICLEKEEYQSAAAFFDEYIREDSQSFVPEAYLYRAMCYQELGRIEDSIFSLELLLQRDDYQDDGWAGAILASSYLKLKRYQSVIEFSDGIDVSEMKPDYAGRIRLYRAESLYQLDRLEESSDIYSELTNSDGEIAGTAWQRLFTIYYRMGKEVELDNLLKDAERSLKSDHKILQDFRMRIGVASYNAEDYETAEKFLLTVWDTSAPSEMSGIVPLYYSRLLERRGKTERSIDILEVFLTSSDDMAPEILIRLSMLYINEGDYKAALVKLDEFFEKFPDSDIDYEAAYLKSFVCYQQKQYEQALEYVARSYGSDQGGARTASLLRLESSLNKKTGNYEKALDKLVRYLDYQPKDISARLELLKLEFLLNDYETILTDSVDFKWLTGVRTEDQRAYLMCSYLTGLSAIALSDYNRAIDELSILTPINTTDSGLTDIYSYALFYKGWALYRNADYSRAVDVFDELIVDYPGSASAPEAAYLAGWCEYINGDYESSSSYFVRYTSLADNEERGRFMYAKNLVELGRFSEAANIFAEIPRENPDSSLADDALFEKASISAAMGNVEQAASDYEYLFRKFGGRLAEEGMFRRGEIYYSAGDYAASATAYYDFRKSFPDSSLFDAALYWGGMANYENGESFGAALLWDNLINDYKGSVFRAPAMLKTASVYADAGDYSDALKMYEKCRLEYPGTEKAAAASHESEKIRLLIGGLSEKEAELNVVITTEGGAGSAEGRRAMIELAALYISMGGSDLKPALSMLNQVLEHRDEDPEAAADAQFYIGENCYRQNRYSEAVKAFIEAAGINPADKDSSARALYRAADTALLAGSPADAEKLIKRLRDYYPGSAWAVEAEKLLEEAE